MKPEGFSPDNPSVTMADVIIDIRRKPKVPRPAPRRGPIDVKRDDDRLGRRHQDLGLSFYDTGQYWNGVSWKDLDVTVDPGLVINTVSGHPVFVFSDFSLTHWQTFYDRLFSVPVAQWATSYRKLEGADAVKYGVSVYQGRGAITLDSISPNPANQLRAENPDWDSSRGLKSIAPWIYVQTTGGLALPFDTNDLTRYKITASNSYAAPSVTLDLSRGADIFLIPRPMFASAEQDNSGSGAGFIACMMWSNWAVKSREIFLEKTLHRGAPGPQEDPAFEGNFEGAFNSNNTAYMFNIARIADSFSNEITAWIKARPTARLYVRHGSGSPTYGDEPLSNFPFPGIGPTAVNNAFFRYLNHSVTQIFSFGGQVIGNLFLGAGTLCAVIRVGGTFYYVWRQTAEGGGGLPSTYWPEIGLASPNQFD
jgi:hypothetical protein